MKSLRCFLAAGLAVFALAGLSSCCCIDPCYGGYYGGGYDAGYDVGYCAPAYYESSCGY